MLHAVTPQIGMYASLVLAVLCLSLARFSRGKVYQALLLVLSALLLIEAAVLGIVVNLQSADFLPRAVGLALAVLTALTGWWIGRNAALLALSSALRACKVGYEATNKAYAQTLTTWSSPLPKPFQPKTELAAKTGCNGGDPAVEQ